jgi:hypothetical protein
VTGERLQQPCQSISGVHHAETLACLTRTKEYFQPFWWLFMALGGLRGVEGGYSASNTDPDVTTCARLSALLFAVKNWQTTVFMQYFWRVVVYWHHMHCSFQMNLVGFCQRCTQYQPSCVCRDLLQRITRENKQKRQIALGQVPTYRTRKPSTKWGEKHGWGPAWYRQYFYNSWMERRMGPAW